MARDDIPPQIPKCMPRDWVAPVSVWVVLVSHSDRPIVAYYGIQSVEGLDVVEIGVVRTWILTLVAQVDGSVHIEFSAFIVGQGYYTWLCIAHWVDEVQHASWAVSTAHQNCWLSPEGLDGSVGVFREMLSIPIERVETLQPHTERRTGESLAFPTLPGPVREHNRGLVSHRVAANAHDLLSADFGQLASDVSPSDSERRCISVIAPTNRAGVCSEQTFDELLSGERLLYFGEIEPALRVGMDFLRAYPDESGCVYCRLLPEINFSSNSLSRTFGLALFAHLTHFKDWAGNHSKRFRAFDSFIAMDASLGSNLKQYLCHGMALRSQ